MTDLKYHDLFAGEVLSGEGFPEGPGRTMIIESVSMQELQDPDPKKRGTVTKPVVRFASGDALVLNKTNAKCLVAMWGDSCRDWLGHRVTIRREMVQFGSGRVAGLRVAGSPDLSEPLTFTLKLPSKKPVQMTMDVTEDTEDREPPEWVDKARHHADAKGADWSEVVSAMGRPPEMWVLADRPRVRDIIDDLSSRGGEE